MTTPESRRPNKSADPGNEPFKDKLGKVIPAEAFENDLGAPRAPAMSEQALAEFDAETERLKASSGRT